MAKKSNEQPKDDLPKLSNPARQALAGVGITRLEQLNGESEKRIAGLHGMGPKGIRELKEALAARGWSFAKP